MVRTLAPSCPPIPQAPDAADALAIRHHPLPCRPGMPLRSARPDPIWRGALTIMSQIRLDIYPAFFAVTARYLDQHAGAPRDRRRLRGIILEKQPRWCCWKRRASAYEVHMPMTCFYELPEARAGGDRLHTTFWCVKDAQLLYGFNNKQERTLFKELIKTKRRGAQAGAWRSSPACRRQFVNAVERGRGRLAGEAAGDWQKTAERLIVEMKDRFKGLHGDLFTRRPDLVLTSPAGCGGRCRAGSGCRAGRAGL